MKSGQLLDDLGCASFNTGVTRCSVFQKSRGSVKSGQVVDDPGCASFNTGANEMFRVPENRGFREIWAGTR